MKPQFSKCVCVCVWRRVWWSDTADALSQIEAGHYEERFSLRCWFSSTDVFSSPQKSLKHSAEFGWHFSVRPGLFNTGICTSNQEFSVAPEGNREFLSHMQLLWRGSLYRRNPSSCVKGLETGWLHGNSKLSVQYLKRWCSLLEII